MTAGPPDSDVYPGQPWDPSHSHVRIYLNGREVSCQFIDTVHVSGGRSERTGNPDPATLAATWIGDWGVQPEVGDRIRVAAIAPEGTRDWVRSWCVPIFDGTVTDVGLDWEPDGTIHVDVNAADDMAALAGVMVGDTPWPQETNFRRFEHVWDRAAAVIGTPNLPPPWEAASKYLGDLGRHANPTVTARDADSQPAVDLIRLAGRHSRTVFVAWPAHPPLWTNPPSKWEQHLDADDPDSWDPKYMAMSDVEPRDRYYASLAPCQVVSADPPPHWTINLRKYSNTVVVVYGEEPAGGGGRPHQTSHAGPVRPTTRDQTWKIDSRLAHDTDARELAAKWRERLIEVLPTLNATVVLTADTLNQAADAYDGNQPHLTMNAYRLRHLMGVLVGGASIVAHPVDIGYRHNMLLERWYIESKTIEWRPDGWQVELVASHQKSYVADDQDANWQPDWVWDSTALVTLQDLHEYEPTTLQAMADRPPSTLLQLHLAAVDFVASRP